MITFILFLLSFAICMLAALVGKLDSELKQLEVRLETLNGKAKT